MKLTTGPIRALPDSAPQPEGERIPYACPEGTRLFVWVDTVIANAIGPLVWWRGNFYAVERKP